MSEPQQPPQTVPSRRRRVAGTVLVALGVAVVLWSVLQVSSAGFGTSPTPSFAQRRAYTQVKREVHEVLPRAFLRALVGLALIAGGRRVLVGPAGDDSKT